MSTTTNCTARKPEESTPVKSGKISYMNINLSDYVTKDYMKHRSAYYKKKNETVAKIFAAILVVSIILTAAVCNAINKDPKLIQSGEIIVEVKSGNTLWGICDDYVPNGMDIRQFIEIVEEYNDMPNGIIYTGEYIRVPMFEKIY